MKKFAALSFGILLVTLCHAQTPTTPTLSTSQCNSVRPSLAMDYFSVAVGNAFIANCTDAMDCAKAYCSCTSNAVTSVEKGWVRCSSPSNAVGCAEQGTCAGALTQCLWSAAVTARNASGGTSVCTTWGADAVAQLRNYADSVTQGTVTSFTYGVSNLGNSCSSYVCGLIANSTAAPCTVSPDVSCPFPLSSAAQVTNVVNSSVDAALLAEYKFSLTVAGNFNAFFSESIETGKLRRSFYDDIAALFQTTNILLTRFANGSLVADFAVRVPQSNRLANKMVGLSESVMKSSTAWLGRTQVTYATKSADTLPTPTVLRTNTGEVTNTATLMSCNKVCFQVILILAGAALLMIFIFFACCMCRGKKKTLHSEWDSKAPGHASPSQPNRV